LGKANALADVGDPCARVTDVDVNEHGQCFVARAKTSGEALNLPDMINDDSNIVRAVDLRNALDTLSICGAVSKAAIPDEASNSASATVAQAVPCPCPLLKPGYLRGCAACGRNACRLRCAHAHPFNVRCKAAASLTSAGVSISAEA
jgi:hypothetical protein